MRNKAVKTLPTGRLHQPSHTRAGRCGSAVTHTSKEAQGRARGRRAHSGRSGGSGTPARAALPGRLIRVSPRVAVLSFHHAQPPTTLPRDHRSWIRDSARSSCVLSCSKLSVAREKKPQCVSGPHYLGRTLRTVHSASPSYRPGLFQRTTMPQTTHKTAQDCKCTGHLPPHLPRGVPPNGSLQACALQ